MGTPVISLTVASVCVFRVTKMYSPKVYDGFGALPRKSISCATRLVEMNTETFIGSHPVVALGQGKRLLELTETL